MTYLSDWYDQYNQFCATMQEGFFSSQGSLAVLTPVPATQYALAALPILIVIGLMIGLRWNAQRAGLSGWLAGIGIGTLAFGLTFEVFFISQVKGLLLSAFVLAVLWPALLLYNVVLQAGGIRAIAIALERLIADRGLRLIVVAWAFSGMLEGLAGFGLPIAIVAPMLVQLGVSPVAAVAAVAVGHAWSVTLGDMGIIFQTLVVVTRIDGAALIPGVALMLGVACLGCGLSAALILHQGRRWRAVLGLAILMAVTQYVLASIGLTSLAAFGAGLMGMLGGTLIGRAPRRDVETTVPGPPLAMQDCRPLISALISYGSLAALMTAIILIRPLYDALSALVWRIDFAEVVTRTGVITPAGPGQVFRPLVHPGTTILLIAILSYLLFRRIGLSAARDWRPIAAGTWQTAAPASAGIVAMIGLSTIMEHCGMTTLLAQGMSIALGGVFPIVSPLVGMLGAFATGSNNNSNVLFAPLQQTAAVMLSISPPVLIAAQTTGGALGSMIAPAKIVVGCSTVGLKGMDGDVLRMTLPYGLLMGLGIGLLTLAVSRL